MLWYMAPLNFYVVRSFSVILTLLRTYQRAALKTFKIRLQNSSLGGVI